MATAEDRGTRRVHTPDDSFKSLFERCANYMDSAALDLVRRAYAFAERAHRGTSRQSGEPYIEHPLAVARWLAERNVTVDCIAAALLHDVVEDTPVSLQRLSNRFGPVVAHLVDGVTKFDAIENPDDADDEMTRIRERKHREQAETLRKLLLAMAEDPRVALIKLADRLHNIRTLDAKRPDRQAAKARETMDMYVPLAARLGMAEVKYELQDTCLRYIDPQRYAWLTRRIAEEVAARASRTEATTRAIQQVIVQHGIDAVVTPRVKHLYSVEQRIAPMNIDVGEINDLITYRILVHERHDCYTTLRAIHSQWQQLDARVRDYIGSPKLNGYQSLHTTVFGMDGLFDVHIRTHEMQRMADHGPVLLAAARPIEATDRTQALSWIEQVRSWQSELSPSAKDFMDAVRGDLFRDQIFIFTPKGDIKDLASGATVLDLAYRIHTDLGEQCSGAKVTGSNNIVRIEGRDYELRSGEIVEIIRDELVHPDASWQRMVRTHHARDSIQHYLRVHGLPVDEVPEEEAESCSQMASIRLAFCCEPGPNDDLLGVANGKRLIVHRAQCWHVTEDADVLTAVASNGHGNHTANGSNGNGHHPTPDSGSPGRQFLHMRWETIHPDKYRISLNITGHDRSGLMHDVAEVIAEADLNLVRVGAQTISDRYKATIWVTVEVRDQEQLQRVSQRLMGVEGVVSIERRDRIPRARSRVALMDHA